MYHKLAEKLVVVSGTPGYSPAIPLAGANSVQVEWTLFNLTGGTTMSTTIAVQDSNDQENWTATLGTLVGTGTSLSGAGYATFQYKQIAAQYVRLSYTASNASGTTTAVLSSGMNTMVM